MSAWVKLGLAVLLIALNGFLVTAEFALVRVRPTRLESLRRAGHLRAAAATELLRHLAYTLATTQVGITLASLGIGWLGEPAIAAILEPFFRGLAAEAYVRPLAFGIGFLSITLATVILGELVPKAIGVQKAESILLLAAAPLRLLRVLLYPVVALTNASGTLVLRGMGLPPAFGEEAVHTEEELRAILGRSHERGQITRVGRDILERVLGFSRLTARQIMVPRPDVVWLSAAKSPAENLEIARSSGYTRFPFCDGDIDRVLGVVHVRDLALGHAEGLDLMTLVRPPVVVPETATADLLLRLFQQRKLHLAIVVDEYGGTSGVLTLEDVLEEIVGEVQDEFDQEPPSIASAGEGRFTIFGSARFEEVARTLGAEPEITEAEVDTVAGFVQDELGRVARVGDVVLLGDYEIRVEETKGNRIVRLAAARGQRAGGPSPGRS